jgi:hypothetical protein
MRPKGVLQNVNTYGYSLFNLQRVQWMKRLGYRDGSVYKGGAGQGASQKVKRQG